MRPSENILQSLGHATRRMFIRAGDFTADAAFRHAQRRRLMGLSDLGLRDIGISRADAWAEYRKPFWRK